MTRSYTMRGVMGAADKAVSLARQHMRKVEPNSLIHDVQEDPRFMHRGIDLLWERVDGSILGIEVKGDRQARRGNYFFELISNFEKDTPGCFLYSMADFMFYVFLLTQEIHVLPLKATREWFLPLAKDFPVKHTRTRMGKEFYTTVGVIVPIRRVQKSVVGASIVKPMPLETLAP